MNSRRLRLFSLLLVLAAFTVGFAAAASDDDDDKAKKKKKKGKGPEIVQVDLSKLHPGIAQYIRDTKGAITSGKTEPKKKKKKKEDDDDDDQRGQNREGKAGREISLADAIGIVERTGQGVVVKAERRKDADEHPFRIDLVSKDGVRTKVYLDRNGRQSKQKD